MEKKNSGGSDEAGENGSGTGAEATDTPEPIASEEIPSGDETAEVAEESTASSADEAQISEPATEVDESPAADGKAKPATPELVIDGAESTGPTEEETESTPSA